MRNRHIEPVWLAQSFLDELVLVYPVYALMILASGIGEFELSLLFVIWAVAAFVLEIPSGVIADRVDRRWFIFAGSVAGACGFLCWWAWPSFWGFALGFVLWSLGSAIHSGTRQALLHDVLAEQHRRDAFARIYGRGKSAQSLAVLAAMGLGGFAAESGYQPVLLLSALAPLLSGMLMVGLLREPPRSFSVTGPAQDSATPGGQGPLRVALAVLGNNRSLRLTAVMFIVFVGLTGVVDEYLGPLLVELGDFSLGIVGLLYGVMLGSRALGTAFAHRIRNLPLGRIGLGSVFGHALLLSGLFLGMRAGGAMMAASIALYFAVMGAVEVLLDASLQQQIDVSARATVTSVAGAGLEVWATALFLSIGLIAGRFSWTAAVSLLALMAVLMSAGLAWRARSLVIRDVSS